MSYTDLTGWHISKNDSIMHAVVPCPVDATKPLSPPIVSSYNTIAHKHKLIVAELQMFEALAW